jgi:RHS repeat-associated protein
MLADWRWRLAMPAVLTAALLAPLVVRTSEAPPEPRPPADGVRGREYTLRWLRGEDVDALRRALLVESLDGERRWRPRPRPSGAAGDFRAAVERLEHLALRAQDGKALTAAELDAARTGFEAADLLVRESFAIVRRRLSEAGVGGEIPARLEAAEARYLALAEPLVAELAAAGKPAAPASPESASALAAALPRLEAALAAPPPQVLRSDLPPFRPTALPPQPPQTQPAVVPAYLDATDPAALAEDYAGSVEAPLSEEILAKAEELGYDYVRIYEWVRNQVETELYFGGVKGAEGVLRSGRGNDVDQASLLIALLRAAQAPARYVHGVVQLTLAEAGASLGLTGATAVTTALARAGIPYEPVIQGGTVAGVRVEHTWVTAWLPYTNYRGAVVDFSGRTWIPLAPSLKDVDFRPPTAVLRQMGFDAGTFLADYLAAPHADLPLAVLRRQVEAHLAGAGGGAFADQLGVRTPVPEELGILPSSMPVPVVAVTGEEPALAAARRHTVRFLARDGTAESDPPVLDVTLPLSEVDGARVSLSYQPATVDDHRTVNFFGGLGLVPAYLVELRPVLKIDGRARAVGEAVAMAVPHLLEVEVRGPWGSARVERTELPGNFLSFAVGAPRAAPRPVPEDDPADTESLGPKLLSRLAYTYGERWDAAEEELGDLFDVAVVRPLPSLAIAANAVAVSQLGGLPAHLDWQGVTLDAVLRIAEPVDRGGAAAGDWMRLAGLHGSALEHAVFESEFLVESVSAAKGLGLARQQGDAVHFVDAGNVGTLLPVLQHPAEVEAEVERRALLGQLVEIPEHPLSLNAWTGSVWRAEDPATGAAGYFLSGGLDGGQTTEPPGSWLLDFLEDALAEAFAANPNTDPLGGERIAFLAESDDQVGEVGDELPTDLTVKVSDGDGRPVEGAIVFFSSEAGGGTLISFEEDPVSGLPVRIESDTLLAVRTNNLGLAGVGLELGESTYDNSVYPLRGPGDEHETQASLHLVDAGVESHVGLLTIPRYLSALAYPGPPDRLATTGDLVHGSLLPSAWVGNYRVFVVDEHDNPISNEAVTFSVAGEFDDGNGCTDRPHLPAEVFDRDVCPIDFPLAGQCGSPSVTLPSTRFGAAAGVITGSGGGIAYLVDADAAGLDTLQSAWVVFQGQACRPLPVGLAVIGRQVISTYGANISAAGLGRSYQPGVTAEFFDREFDGAGIWRWIPELVESVGADITGGGFVTPPVPFGFQYRSFASVGSTPQHHLITVDAVDQEGFGLSAELEIAAVEPRIDRTEPEPYVLSADGLGATDLTIHFSVQPEDYSSQTREIFLYENGQAIAALPINSVEGDSFLGLGKGFPFDLESDYRLELVLNRGTEVEVRSQRYRLQLDQQIIRSYEPGLAVSREVDLPNGLQCSMPTVYDFSLTRQAIVDLTLQRIEALDPDGSPVLGSELRLISGQVYGEGDQTLEVTPDDVPPGDYVLTLTARDGDQVEQRMGSAISQFTSRDALPVGQSLIKGVNPWSGGLTLNRTDFQVPGRGPSLSLSRSYSSNAGKDPGVLGAGWVHNYESKVLVTPCSEAIVVGGEGSGMRFVPDGDGGLRPLRGYHGSLQANDDGSFDFFTIGGNRYHYVFAAGSEWYLHEISDPDGNVTTLSYTPSNGKPLLRQVRDPAGRTLTFDYEFRAFPWWKGDVLVGVFGPDGLSLHFTYDDFGNLTEASREDAAVVETYAYEQQPSTDHETRYTLKSTTNALNGAVTTYSYDTSDIGFEGGMFTGVLVTSVTEPLGGVTVFDYDEESLATRANSLRTGVTDRAGETWVYTFDRYGSPLAIEDPLSHTMSTTWKLSDVVIASRTDANGVVTTFEYDEHGNVTEETVDGETTVTTYEPPESFDPPFIKNRVKARTDRNGHTTTFDYDSRGNLTEQRITVSHPEGGNRNLITRRTYTANGDLKTITDPQGHTTAFTYDAWGNVETVTDPQGFVAESEWNARGLRIRHKDARGNETTFEHDRLGRVTDRHLPDGDTETYVYDDLANVRTETDAAGRSTVTEYDLEGRVTRITNAAGGVMVLDYDEEGRKTLESTWFDGETPRFDVIFEYDPAGRLVQRTEPLGRITTYDYDPAGNLTRETLSGGDLEPRVTETDYDDLHRVTEIRRLVEGGPAIVRMEYDGEGNKTLEVDPLGRQTTFEYDELDRLVRMTEPEGKVTVSSYDGNGNLVETRQVNDTGSGDQIRELIYDPSNRLASQIDAAGGVRTFEYDAVGNLETEVDARGNVTRHTYDERNRRRTTTVSTAALGDLVTRFDYDAVGNIRQETWPNGNVLVHDFDGLNRLRSTTDSLGTMVRYRYDARSNRVREIDAKGNEVVRHFDALDRLVQQDLPEDRTLVFDYDLAGNRTLVTDARGNTATFTYDTLDRLVESTDPAPFSYTVSTVYDLAGNVLSRTDRRGNTATYEYDGLDRVTRRVDPPVGAEQYEVGFTYDRVGNVLTATDRRGIVTAYRDDRENRRTEVRRDGLVIETATWDGNGNVETRTDANGNTTTYSYDERDLLLAQARPLGATDSFAYDAMGDTLRLTDAEGKTVERAYDVRRRLETETRFGDGGAEATTFGYDANGNRTSLERPEGGTWRFEYDGADRLTAVVDPESNRTEYTWDANDNLESFLDAAGRSTDLTWDELDRLQERRFPGSAAEHYTYDENGNLVERQDANGQVVTIGYDALGRETSRSFPADAATADDLLSIAVAYDPNNNPLTVTESFELSGAQLTTRTFDTFDRLQSVTDRWGNSLTHGYDVNGNRTRLTDPDSKTTSYGYDALNRLRTVNLPGGGLTRYDYLLNSRLETITYPNGTTASHTYDGSNRLTAISNLHNATTVSTFLYEYDANGNRTSQTETRFGESAEVTAYGYDLADRLTLVVYPDKTTTFTYDEVGNRETEIETDAGGNLITHKLYAYDPRNQLTELDNLLDPNRNVTYGYDGNGNQVSRLLGDGSSMEFDFDVRNQLVRVEQDGLPVGTYGYDAQGLRITKQTAGGLARYVYDQDSVLLRRDDSGTKKYDYGPDRLLSVDDSALGRAYYLFDALGSVVDLTTPAGTLLAQYKYDAWGNLRSSVDTPANVFGFTGHEMDPETGLIYAKARFYDPEIGRFLSHDPFEGDVGNPPSLHRYLYAFANPTSFVDPTGELPVLNEIKDFFKRGGVDQAAELAGDVQEEFGTVAGVLSGIVLGIAGAAADTVAAAVEVVDTVANAVVAGVAPDSELGQQAAAELNETIDSVTETFKVIKENPGAVGAALVDGVVETVRGVASGDAEAVTRATAAIADLATGGKTAAAGVGKKAANVAETVANGAKAVTKRLDGGGSVTKTVTAANRQRRRLTQGTGKARPDVPAAATRGAPIGSKKCFVAGTLVATQGGLTPIEDIAVGDLVWARSEETGELALRPVVQLFETPDQPIVEVDVESADGSVETLGTTYEHPFRVAGLGWVPAGRLQPGDRLSTHNDDWREVRRVRATSPRGPPRRETVYNFEVAEDHTYFVGESGVWVHNLCEAGKQRLAELRGRRAGRQRGEAVPSDNPGFARHAQRDRAIQAEVSGERLIGQAQSLKNTFKEGITRDRTTPAILEVPQAGGSTRRFFSISNNKINPRAVELAEELGLERVFGRRFTAPGQTDAEQILLNFLETPEGRKLLSNLPEGASARIAPAIRACGPSRQNCAGRIDASPRIDLVGPRSPR